jgi:DNA modification methylase
MIKLMQGDCLKLMREIPDGSIDMVLCDLPYQQTACSWDKLIPFEPLWAHYKRVIKPNGAIVLFGSQPFTSALVMSNHKWFKYCWIWQKEQGTNFQSAKYQPLKNHEEVIIFGKGRITYNPQMTKGQPFISGKGESNGVYGKTIKKQVENFGTRYPKTVQKFNRQTGLHPTQKPVPLLEYLIKTYTNEGETVLDNCMGSGSTIVAAKNLNRRAIGIEMEPTYFNLAKERIGALI